MAEPPPPLPIRAIAARERGDLIEVVEEVVGLGTYVWVPGRDLAWSRGVFRLLGLDPQVPVTADVYYRHVHPDDRARVVMAASTVVTRGEVESFPYRLVRADGSFDWVRGNVIVERDAAGAVARVIGTIVRITDSYQAAERLAQVNALLADTQRAAGIGSYVFDLTTGRLEWSDELYRVLGVDPATPIDGALAHHLVHEDDRARQYDWGRRVAQGERLPPLLVRIVRPSDGRVVYLESISRRVERPGGPCVVGVSNDVTARVELEQELRHAARAEAVGALAAGIAHDFNNYLTVLAAQLELLRLDGGAPSARDLDVMGTALERCAGLVRQLLAFARKLPYRPERLDLAGHVEGVRHLFERVAGGAVALEVVITARPTVEGDATQLDGALMNLLVNARDAMPAGGTIRVTLDELELAAGDPRLDGRLVPGRHARLAVRDTGTGIAPELLPRVFEPYVTTKSGDGGTGLGLAAVLGTARQHGGTARIESAPGQGTTVELLLPVMTGVGAAAVAPAHAREAPRALRLLLVEDMAPVREALAALLRGEGHEVTTAVDGQDALDRLATTGVDLVLSDVSMPRLSGVALARALRARVPPIPVVLMTGYADHGEAHDVALTLDKPFSRDELVAAIERVLG